MDFSNISIETLILDAAAVAAILVAWWTYNKIIKRQVQIEEAHKHTIATHEQRIARLEAKDTTLFNKIETVEGEVVKIGQSVARIEGMLSPQANRS